MYKILAKIWTLFQAKSKWHILWLFHDKFMIGVSGIIFNKDYEILLLRHRFWKKDTWGFPSGYAIKNEKLEDALTREIKEETNLDVLITRLIYLKSGFKLRIECTYIGNCSDTSLLKIASDEILEAKFFPIDSLPGGLIDSHKSLIKEFENIKQRSHGNSSG